MLVPHGVRLRLARDLNLLHSFRHLQLLRSFRRLQMLHSFCHAFLHAREARLHLHAQQQPSVGIAGTQFYPQPAPLLSTSVPSEKGSCHTLS